MDVESYIDIFRNHDWYGAENPKNFGRDLDFWRIRRGMSKRSLSYESNFDATTMYKIIRGERVRLSTIERILNYIASKENAAPPAFEYGALKVLVVDDNATNHMVVTSLLGSMVKQIDVAENGVGAIQALELAEEANSQYDVVLMDIHMPVMDGIEATLAIRGSQQNYTDIPIIALTADPNYQQRRLVKNIGMDGVLSKPVKLTELAEEIKIVLQQSPKEKYARNKAEPSKSASIQTVWKGQKIHASAINIRADIPKELSTANLLSLKEEFRELADSLGSGGNFDIRVVKYLEKTCELIGTGEIDSLTLFKLIRREAVLFKFEKTILDQWPDFLAAQYSALCSQMEEVLDSFSERRAFRRSIVEAELEDVDFDQFSSEFSSVPASMRKNFDIIDISVPKSIEEIDDSDIDLDDKPKNLIMADQLESTSNVLKALLDAAGNEKMAKQALDNIANSYAKGVTEGVLRGAEQAGASDGEKLGAAAARGLMAKETSHMLSDRFPKVFGWLKRFDN